MKTEKQHTQILLVLVPHRDVRLALRNYSAALFKAGFDGAYHFPWAAPLAALSRPLDTDELKLTSRVLRKAAGVEKIIAAETSTAVFSSYADGFKLFGPRLNLVIPPETFGGGNSETINDTIASKIICLFSPVVIGACLLPETEAENTILPPPPLLSFRAAATANMYWKPFNLTGTGGGALGYKWKIGNLCWLPAVRKSKTGKA